MTEAYISGKRIPELDFFRGLAFVLMFIQHAFFDLRHVLGQDVLAFQDTAWFMDWLRPIILLFILLVSGISCTFSRNNFKRAGILLLYALGVTLAFELVSYFGQMSMHVYFNVFHLLTVGIFLYAVITVREKAVPEDARKDRISLLLLVFGVVCLYLGTAVERTPYLSHNYLLFLGLRAARVPAMADYLPIFPWFGIFLVGAAIGRRFYRSRVTLLTPTAVRGMATWGRPFNFIGRHPLLIYAIHQPLILAALWGILKLMGRL